MLRLATKFAPTHAAFEVARQAGFRAVELWTDADTLLRHAEIARLARSFPFAYAIHFPNHLDQPPEVIDAAAHLYRALDATALILHQPHQDRHGSALAQACPGIRLAVENHKLTEAGLIEWAERNPGITLDVEHLWMYTYDGEPMSRVLAETRTLLQHYGSRLRHVHLPGYLPGQGEHRPMYCSRELTRGVWDLLVEIGYRGLVVSEVNPEFQNIHDLSMDVLLYERWMLDRAAPTA